MTNIELLKAICDALIAAVGVLKNRLDDCDSNESDEAHVVTHNLELMQKMGDISVRVSNCLLRAGFVTLEDVVYRIESPQQLQKIRNMGPHSICEVIRLAHNCGLKWRWEG